MATKSTKTIDPSTSFEHSIKELEAIVTSMEEEQLPLEDLITRYERGAILHKECEVFLNSAKKRLETIANTSSNDSVKAETKAPTKKANSSTTNNNPDDEIRLF